jgi:hypothetical protein
VLGCALPLYIFPSLKFFMAVHWMDVGCIIFPFLPPLLPLYHQFLLFFLAKLSSAIFASCSLGSYHPGSIEFLVILLDFRFYLL